MDNEALKTYDSENPRSKINDWGRTRCREKTAPFLNWWKKSIPAYIANGPRINSKPWKRLQPFRGYYYFCLGTNFFQWERDVRRLFREFWTIMSFRGPRRAPFIRGPDLRRRQLCKFGRKDGNIAMWKNALCFMVEIFFKWFLIYFFFICEKW